MSVLIFVTNRAMSKIQRKRVALVTGANRGIGFEISRQLAGNNISVIMGARDREKGLQACSELKRQGLDVGLQLLDVNDEERMKPAIDKIMTHFGRVDILVNNAGISIDAGATALNVGMDTVHQTLQTNVLGPLRLCQACIPHMQSGNYGRIVNMASTLGSISEMSHPDSVYAGVQSPAYRLSKAALNAVTALIAKDVSGLNILVNSVCPGWVRTDIGGSQAPLTPEQGADTPVWLATLPDDGPNGGFFRDRTTIPW